MKDLILIGAYCPDTEREILLNNCIDSIQKIRNDFDILICSHSIIPEYISRKVDYIFYDKNNDLINDMMLMNRPWFSPMEGMTIYSTFISNYSTYFSTYRNFIGGCGIAKNYCYKKIHYLEYDSIINNYKHLYDNSKLLNEYDCVVIKKNYKPYEENLDWIQGFFVSINLETLDQTFLKFDRNKLLEILKDSEIKTNEKITEDFLTKNKKFYVKNYDDIICDENKYNLSREISDNSLNGWFVPFYNSKNDLVQVIVWNKKETPVDVKFIINTDKIISVDNVQKFAWSIKDVDKLEEINSIVTIVNGKIKNEIKFDEKLKQEFKITNHAVYD